jgi:drug/metabolite transporter (DMT)-like permease
VCENDAPDLSALIVPRRISGSPSFLTSKGIARIGAAHTAIIGAAGPIATLLMAWLLLGEAITALPLLGTILVLYGVRQASSSPTR